MTLRRGTSGEAVATVQTRLRELGFYRGVIDGAYGGGTEGAVKSFQHAQGLSVDGDVGSLTWTALFPSLPMPESDLHDKPVSYRCLVLTGAFETTCLPPDCFCGLTGDFDGQGMSFGALQWNMGHGTLQPMLHEMISAHRWVCLDIFHEHLPRLESVLKGRTPDQLAFARSIQDRRHRFFEPWKGMFRTLGRTSEFCEIQARAAARLFTRAREMAMEYSLSSARGMAMMFDILTQNGSISASVKADILREFAGLPEGSREEQEVARMRIVARRRAAAARADLRDDVLARKLTIADGTGIVHNLRYDLEEQFGLTLQPLVEAAAGGQ
jgi:hypothetical protein